MLTIFTTCKPFVGATAVHQRNALISWTLLEPRPEVVVFGDEDGVAQEAKSLGLRHIESVERDEHGLPRLDVMFVRAQILANNILLMWSNADIIMVSDVMEAARKCDETFPGGFLGVCRRWDVNLFEPLDFTGDWRTFLLNLMLANGELYTPCSSDMFLFKRPLPWTIPPFVAGRPKWDNFMLWSAAQHRTPVVDLTDAVLLVHPRHGYGHDGKTEQKAWRGHPSGRRNEELAAGKEWCFHHVRRAGWLWKLTADGEVEKV